MMTGPAHPKPQAFVIMPYGDGFDEIYGLFIAGAVAEAGYDVVRADDIRSQQNIMKDVLTGIADSALIVADLTGSNPNVYYELGLAHALGKRVVLLAQQVDELPFDLRSYRVIPYSTHFAEISKAREQLLTVARDALNDKIVFGSPVSDFLAAAPTRTRSLVETLTEATSAPEPGEPGLLDHLVGLEEGFSTLGAIVNATNAEMTTITIATGDTGDRLKALTQSQSPASARRAVVVTFAGHLLEFSNSLATHNADYASALASTRASLEAVIRAHKPTTDDEKAQMRAFLTQLDQAEESARGQRTALTGLIESIRSSPRIERSFNRAADAAVRNLEGYAQNVDQTLSMMVRARELATNRLAESAG